MDSYEQWTRNEIARLRSEAEKAFAEAATLQRTLDKWLESEGLPIESPGVAKSIEQHGPNGSAPRRRGRRVGHGDKNSTALEKITAASPKGLTTDELFTTFAEIFGPSYKRSSLRALLCSE